MTSDRLKIMNDLSKKRYISGLLLIFLVVFTSCENDELKVVEYPIPTVTGFSPATGRPGTEVTISGEDFGDYALAVNVLFNGVEAEVDSVSDTQIQFTVPNEAISGALTVTVWTHAVETAEAFTVIPGAKISGISPEEGEPGDQITISGESFGRDANEVTVLFENGDQGVAGAIESLTETEIVVTVPDGGLSGAIKVIVGPQEIEGPEFTYPFNAFEFLFDTEGDAEGWASGNGSTSEVSFGVMKVNFDMSADKRRADFAQSENVTVHAGNYPIIAIRMIDRPASGNLIFDTSLGSYKNGSNNWDGVIHDNVYYYDLRSTFGSDNNLSQTAETILSTFQWKVADVTTDETGYFVDWVRSFANVAELESYVAEQHPGQQWYGFTGPERTIDGTVLDGWIGRTDCGDQCNNAGGTTTTISEGYEKVMFTTPSDGVGQVRADFNYSHGGSFGQAGSGIAQTPWAYDPEYPIYAIKIHFVQNDGTLGGPLPANGGVRYDRLGNFDETYADSNNVLWVDATDWGGDEPKTEGSWWAVVIDKILSDEQGYWVDWHRQYRSVEEMEFYLGVE